jgi:arsenite methyltransferase
VSSRVTKASSQLQMNEVSFTLPDEFNEGFRQSTPANNVEMVRQDRAGGIARLGFYVAVVLPLLGCAHGNRDSWQQPGQVIAALKIDRGERVADLGAGDGYFTFRLARYVGPQGRVMAVEIDEDKLSELSRKATELGLPNVEAVLANKASSVLGVRSVDLILVCNTYHHIGERVRYFREVKRALRHGGRVAIIELDKLPWIHSVFLGSHSTPPPETIRREMRMAGYRLQEAHSFLEYQSFQVFSAAEAKDANNHP